MIFIQMTEQIKSLSNLLLLLNDRQYNQKIVFLGNASIGGHTRHIIELLKCVTDGYNLGKVDYLNRVRDLSLETDKTFAAQELAKLKNLLAQSDKRMKLVTEYGGNGLMNGIRTTYFREIVYNTEHAIHHLALIKVALREMELDIVEDDFGMAYATIKYFATQEKTRN